MRLNSSCLVACVVVGLGLIAGGCSHNNESACRDVKPGVITTANKVCIMVNADPVNPEVAPVEWKGQKYGLCCNGCRPKWNKLTDAQKDEAAAKVMALSK